MLALSRGECQPRPARSRAYDARVGMRSARGRRRAGGRLRRGLAGFTALDLVRALWLGTIVGLAAGAVAILFFELLELSTRYVLTGLTGYAPPESFGQGGAEAEGPTRRWALPLVAGLGGLASGVVLFLLVPNARTHGMDEAIDAFHRHGGRLPWRGVPAMLFGSVLTIGSGGAAGAEGPAAGIGSGLGSAIAGRLGLSAAETGAQDRPQRALVGFAVVSGDLAAARALASEAQRFAERELLGRAEIVGRAIEETVIGPGDGYCEGPGCPDPLPP